LLVRSFPRRVVVDDVDVAGFIRMDAGAAASVLRVEAIVDDDAVAIRDAAFGGVVAVGEVERDELHVIVGNVAADDDFVVG